MVVFHPAFLIVVLVVVAIIVVPVAVIIWAITDHGSKPPS